MKDLTIKEIRDGRSHSGTYATSYSLKRFFLLALVFSDYTANFYPDRVIEFQVVDSNGKVLRNISAQKVLAYREKYHDEIIHLSQYSCKQCNDFFKWKP